MVDLIAKSNFYYGPRKVRKGETFACETADQAKALVWYGRADYVAAPASNAEARRGEYQRRDMQARPVGTADPAKPVARTTPGEDMSRAASEPPAEPAAEAPPPARGDLSDMTRKELYELAEREGIDVAATDLKASMVEKIKAARAERQG